MGGPNDPPQLISFLRDPGRTGASGLSRCFSGVARARRARLLFSTCGRSLSSRLASQVLIVVGAVAVRSEQLLSEAPLAPLRLSRFGTRPGGGSPDRS